MCTNSVVRIDGGIAFSVCTQTEDELKNNVYVYQKDELQNIYSCSTNIPMSFISKITDNELAFFCPDSAIEEGDEYYIYQILKIDIEEGSSAKIKEFNYNISEQSGEIISTIDSHDGLVYIFKKSAEKQDNIYSICVLDSDGNLREEYSVDISDFLYLELTSTYDSIYKMECLEENLIALQTINNRILILDIENNKIRFISAPDVLSAFPEGYKIAGYSDDVKQDIYFVNMYNDKLIRLDVGSKEFFECNIQSDLDEMHVSALNINSEGNILIKTAESFYISKNNKYSVCPESMFSLNEPETVDTEDSEVADRPAYELESIDEERYEKNGKYVEFYDMPENDAETIVCYSSLFQIMGTYYKIYEFFYDIPEYYENYEKQEESDTEQNAYEWIKVEEVSTLSFDDIIASTDYEMLFGQLRAKLTSIMGLEEYIKMILDNGCQVVYVKYCDKYTEEFNSRLPQGADGEHEEYWLFVLDSNNQYRVWDYTAFFMMFNFNEDMVSKEDIPDCLMPK